MDIILMHIGFFHMCRGNEYFLLFGLFGIFDPVHEDPGAVKY